MMNSLFEHVTTIKLDNGWRIDRDQSGYNVYTTQTLLDFQTPANFTEISDAFEFVESKIKEEKQALARLKTTF